MKIAILTTDPRPHRWFCNQLAAEWDVRVFYEDEPPDPEGYGPPPHIKLARDHLERQEFGAQRPLYESASYGWTLNGGGAVHDLRAYSPDVIFVLETLKLGSEIIGVRPDAIFNFHSADPHYARGLNCDLWSIYHGEFPCVGCHLAVEALD